MGRNADACIGSIRRLSAPFNDLTWHRVTLPAEQSHGLYGLSGSAPPATALSRGGA